eukprot:scaffold325_cov230-Pinguiococcus_pyrenoidosus.AAC.4
MCLLHARFFPPPICFPQRKRQATKKLTFVPWNPLRLGFVVRLEIADLLHQLVVHVPVVLRAEEVGHDDHVVVLQLLAIARPLLGHQHAQIRPHERARRVEALGVPPSSVPVHLPHAAAVVLPTRIILQLAKLRVHGHVLRDDRSLGPLKSKANYLWTAARRQCRIARMSRPKALLGAKGFRPVVAPASWIHAAIAPAVSRRAPRTLSRVLSPRRSASAAKSGSCH